MAMSSVKITVWPVNAPSFYVQWAMPTGLADERVARTLLDSVLRANEMSNTECTAEVQVDSTIVVGLSQQVRLVRRIRHYPKG